FHAAQVIVHLRPRNDAVVNLFQALLFLLQFAYGTLRDLSSVVQRNHGDAVAIGNDHVAWPHGDSSAGDGCAYFTGAIAIAAIGAESARIHRKPQPLQREAIAHAAIDDHGRDAYRQRAACEQLTEGRVRDIVLSIDDENIAGPGH